MLMSISVPRPLLISTAVWLLLAGKFNLASTERLEVCQHEPLRIDCSRDEVIHVLSAQYGHHEVGRCIKTPFDAYIGCTNDVIGLFTRWCSGRKQCDITMSPNEKLEDSNTKCRGLMMYLIIEYRCQKVTSCPSPSSKKSTLTASAGTLSSQVTAENGCGSRRSPWLIQASPGQTVDVTLVDFVADGSQSGSSFVTCQRNYGYILERALGINHTICGGNEQRQVLYQSKMNTVEIVMTGKSNHFLLDYSVQGCADIKRPANTWYKREGDEAVIGCETNDQEWPLTCSGNTWHGIVGNCSDPVIEQVQDRTKQQSITKSSTLPVHCLVILTAIVGVSVVVIVAAIMCGVIHMKKYKLKQDRKRIPLHVDYATLGRRPGTMCKPQIPNDNLICMDPPQHHNVLRDGSEREPIWKMPLPDPHGNNTSHPGDNSQGNVTSRGQSESATLMENFVAKYCPLDN